MEPPCGMYSGDDPPDDRWCPMCWERDPFRDPDEAEPEFGPLCEQHAAEFATAEKSDYHDESDWF